MWYILDSFLVLSLRFLNVELTFHWMFLMLSPPQKKKKKSYTQTGLSKTNDLTITSAQSCD